ncbi:enoyl-CoA hydratase-related protein [Peterkaempfera bronchialis]|uniref:Enoyl-CoA hydratase n=1 Tax=Peterkaempfera bronchialis TaxID=2126346 RepID=A0A345SR04_9ACTN|nr:enoyl-CoA hydratase-related protein [Peterkaempfera bronchialis]AXI76159.1 enoyl-CoA hydratase [Peterkaempfera bronchialis]AXI81043.1 enoyl-CoA hydratase [Peterkaempfera bronchialis]
MTSNPPDTEEPTELVLRDLDDAGVLTLTWNRPHRRNGWNPDLENAYFRALDEAADDPAVRAIVVTGAGKAFCPGVDMQRLAGLTARPMNLAGRRPHHHARGIPKPMIAAINGACAGVGLIQALLCDVRFAASGARFATSFSRRGLPAERGISWLLPRLTGVENALDLLLSGRTVDAAEAKGLGLVSRVLPADEVLAAAQAYARDLAVNSSPQAMAVIRRQVLADLEADFATAYDRSLNAMAALTAHPDFGEGVASFTERRPPRFAPLPAGLDPEVLLAKPQPTTEGDAR